MQKEEEDAPLPPFPSPLSRSSPSSFPCYFSLSPCEEAFRELCSFSCHELARVLNNTCPNALPHLVL